MDYNIEIRVDPLVKRWIQNRFTCSKGIYFLGKSLYYSIVSAMLYQSHIATPSQLPKKYSHYETIRLAITEFDFYHYGWSVSPMQEVRFSRLIRNLIIDECLRRAAILRASFNISLAQAINSYFVYHKLSEQDIKYDTLRKIYNRKYIEIEQDYLNFNKLALSNFGYNDKVFEKKTIPTAKRRKTIDNNQLNLFYE